jgi:hypothetical protein
MPTPHRVEIRTIHLEQKLADTEYDAKHGTLSPSYTTFATGVFDVYVEGEDKLELTLTAEIGPDDSQTVAKLKRHFHKFSKALLEATKDWGAAPAAAE